MTPCPKQGCYTFSLQVTYITIAADREKLSPPMLVERTCSVKVIGTSLLQAGTVMAADLQKAFSPAAARRQSSMLPSLRRHPARHTEKQRWAF